MADVTVMCHTTTVYRIRTFVLDSLEEGMIRAMAIAVGLCNVMIMMQTRGEYMVLSVGVLVAQDQINMVYI